MEREKAAPAHASVIERLGRRRDDQRRAAAVAELDRQPVVAPGELLGKGRRARDVARAVQVRGIRDREVAGRDQPRSAAAAFQLQVARRPDPVGRRRQPQQEVVPPPVPCHEDRLDEPRPARAQPGAERVVEVAGACQRRAEGPQRGQDRIAAGAPALAAAVGIRRLHAVERRQALQGRASSAGGAAGRPSRGACHEFTATRPGGRAGRAARRRIAPAAGRVGPRGTRTARRPAARCRRRGATARGVPPRAG